MEDFTDFTEKLRRAASFPGIRISDEQAFLFHQFYQDLVQKNRVMNLTAITDEDGVIVKHFADSLSLIRILPFLGGAWESEKTPPIRTVIDVGTGAGFPGIPLAILFPQIRFTLADSLNKRILFLKEECEKLSLNNVSPVHARAEDLAHDKSCREQFDLCVSRAVANLSTLSEYCIPFIHKNGYFIPYKSGNVEEELRQAEKAVHILGGRIEKTDRFCLSEDAGNRTLILIRKVKETPLRFPRKAGLPLKKPILSDLEKS